MTKWCWKLRIEASSADTMVHLLNDFKFKVCVELETEKKWKQDKRNVTVRLIHIDLNTNWKSIQTITMTDKDTHTHTQSIYHCAVSTDLGVCIPVMKPSLEWTVYMQAQQKPINTFSQPVIYSCCCCSFFSVHGGIHKLYYRLCRWPVFPWILTKSCCPQMIYSS